MPISNHLNIESSLFAWIRNTIGELLGISPGTIALDARFRDLGLRSLHITTLMTRLSERVGRNIPPTAAWQHPTPAALVRHAAVLTAGASQGTHVSDLKRSPTSLSEPIAVIGLGCRFPGGASSPETLWRLLCEGQNGICEIPAERWDAEAYLDDNVAQPGKMTTRWGGFLQDVDRFDAAFFGISPREAQQMDPQQRHTLEVAWEALEDSGIDPGRLRGSAAGVFIGSMWSDYARLTHGDPEAIDAHTATGQDTSIISARISYFLGLRGGSLTVNTACSSSAVAIHLACQSLRNGESCMALAGGVHLMTSPHSTVVMTKFGAMNPDGQCRAFDASANGYVRGEGVGIVVLKPLSRAIADGDRIYCVIRGSAINNDGFSNGLTAPNPEAQEAVLRAAYAAACVEPSAIHYIETHGPGTILGDPIEAGAIGAVLGPFHSAERPLRIGSIKTNLGHTEGAAGVAGLIKVALCLHHRMLPPNLHFEQPNPYINFDALNIRVQTKLESWPWPEELPRAGVSSFGFGGTNCHIVLEAAPSSTATVLPVSAPSAKALRRRLVDALGLFSEVGHRSQAAALCRELAMRDGNASWRAALSVADVANLQEALSARLREQPSAKHRVERPRLVFVCPGHGSQWLGMGRSLLASEPVFLAEIQACDRLIQKQCGWSLIDELLAESAVSRLGQHDVAQLAIFSISIALGALWRSWAIKPDTIVGHSVGEVAACVLGGILSLEDGVRIVATRAQLMCNAASGSGGLLLVSLPDGNIERISELTGSLSVAGYNSPYAVLLAGPLNAIDSAEARLRDSAIEVHRVKVDVAPHSPAMDPILEKLRQELQGLSPKQARVPVRSTVRDNWLAGAECGPGHWVDNLRQPVRFRQAIEALTNEGPTVFLELGAHPVLLGAIQQTLETAPIESWALASCWRGADERGALLSTLATLYELGFEADWEAVLGPRAMGLLAPARQIEDIDEAFDLSAERDSTWRVPLPIVLSAKSEAALRGQAERLRAHLCCHEDLALADVACSLATTRAQFEHRTAVVASDRATLLAALEAVAQGRPHPSAVLGRAGSEGKVVFVFPGQGSQWEGMALSLLETSPVFQAQIESCERALAPHVDWSLLAVLRGEGDTRLDRVDVVQPALFAVMVSLAALWRSLGVEPDAVVGHSQGEVAAAFVSGALSLEDAAKVVALRSRALTRLVGKGAMAAVELGVEALRLHLTPWGDRLSIAAMNGPHATLVSGDPEAVEALLSELAAAQVFVRKIRVDYASHCAQVEAVHDKLLGDLARLAPSSGALPLYSTVTGCLIEGNALDADYWYQNLRQPVRFAEVTETLLGEGYRFFIEVSPHPVLTLAVQETVEGSPLDPAVVGSLRREEGSLARLLLSLAELHSRGLAFDWNAFFAPHAARRVTLPTYAFQRERFWLEAPKRKEAEVAAVAPRDSGFWQAVESGDLDSLGGALRVNDEARRAALAMLLPTLADWRRQSREQGTVDGWRYRVVWKPVAGSIPPMDLSGNWLVVLPASYSEDAVVSGLIHALVERRARVVALRARPEEADRARLAAALREAVAEGDALRGVLSLLALDESPLPAEPVVPTGLALTLSLVQALGDLGIQAPLWLLTRGAVSIGPSDPLNAPLQAFAWGLGRVVGLEHPERWGGLLDLPDRLDPQGDRAPLGRTGQSKRRRPARTSLNRTICPPARSRSAWRHRCSTHLQAPEHRPHHRWHRRARSSCCPLARRPRRRASGLNQPPRTRCSGCRRSARGVRRARCPRHACPLRRRRPPRACRPNRAA